MSSLPILALTTFILLMVIVSSSVLVNTQSTTPTPPNIITMQPSGLEVMILPCSDTDITNIIRPNLVALVTSNATLLQQAGFDKSTMLPNNFCERLTIGPNVNFKAVIQDETSPMFFRHLKIDGLTTKYFHFSRISYDTIAFLHESSTSSSSSSSSPSSSNNFIPRNKLPSIEIRNSLINYNEDFVGNQVTDADSRSIVTMCGGSILGAVEIRVRSFLIENPRYTLLHFIFENNTVNMTVPVSPLAAHNSANDDALGCVLLRQVTVDGELLFKNNRIRCGIPPLHIQSIALTDVYRSSLLIENNVMHQDSDLCTDDHRCSIRNLTTLFEHGLGERNPRIRSIRIEKIFFPPSSTSSSHYPLFREKPPPSDQELKQRPLFSMLSNVVSVIQRKFVPYNEEACVSLAVVFPVTDGESAAGGSNDVMFNVSSPLRHRPVLITDNTIFVDYDTAQYRRTASSFADGEAAEYFAAIVRYSGLSIQKFVFNVVRVEIARNKIDLLRVGNTNAIQIDGEIEKSNYFCYRRASSEEEPGLFLLANNTIVMSSKTKEAQKPGSPLRYLGLVNNAITFAYDINHCDKVLIQHNSATIEVFRPKFEPIMPTGGLAEASMKDLEFSSTLSTFIKLEDISNVTVFEASNNDLHIQAEMSSSYLNVLGFLTVPQWQRFVNCAHFRLRENRAKLIGGSQSKFFVVFELEKTVNFLELEIAANEFDATESSAQPCTMCPVFRQQLPILSRKFNTQQQLFASLAMKGASSVKILRNKVMFRASLTRDPVTGIIPAEQSDSVVTGLCMWTFQRGDPIEDSFWTVHANTVTVLPPADLQFSSSAPVNLLQQASNPFYGIIIGPFRASSTESALGTSLHLDARDNVFTLSTGTASFLALSLNSMPSSALLIENNTIRKELLLQQQQQTSSSSSLLINAIRSVQVIGTNSDGESVFNWQMMPARSNFIQIFDSTTVLSSSSSSSVTLRNNTFDLRNSLEERLLFVECSFSLPPETTTGKDQHNFCLQTTNTTMENNHIHLHQVLQQNGANTISLFQSNSTASVANTARSVDSSSSSPSIRFNSNDITFHQTSPQLLDSLCTIVSSVDNKHAILSDLVATDNNITFLGGCRVASLYDLQAYSPSSDDDTISSFRFEGNQMKRENGQGSTSTTTTALMSINEAETIRNLEAASNNRGAILVNLKFHLNSIIADTEDSNNRILGLVSYHDSSVSSTSTSPFRRNFTKVDVSAIENVCNSIINNGAVSSSESLLSTTFLNSSFISVPHLEDRGCSPIISDNNSSDNTTALNTTTQAPDDNNDEVSTHDQTLATSTDVLQGIGIGAVGAAAAVVPSLGFGVARQQAVLNFVQNVRSGNCAGVKAIDGVPAADSPTQMSIGSSESRLYVGGVAGNFLLSFLLVVFGEIFGALILWKSKSSSWNKPFAVFARCNVALILFVCSSLLLAPTLTFGLVALTQSDVTLGEKVLAAIFSLFGFAVPAFGYAFWSLFVRTNRTQEQYRKVPREGNAKNASKLKKFITYWFVGEGEWMIPRKATLEENLQFDAATPLIEGYNSRAKWFGLAEFVVMFGLALAPFCANLSPVEKSCVTQFAVLLVVLTGFLLLCLFFRPFQELFNRIAVPVVTLCEIAVIVVAYVFAENPPPFIMTLAVLTSSLQSFMAVIVLIASLSPLTKHIMRAWKRFSRKVNSKSNKSGNRNSTKHHHQQRMSLRDLLNDGEDEELKIVNSSDKNKENSRDDNNTTRSSQKHHDQQEKGSSTRTKNSHARARDQEKDHRDDSRRHRSDSTRDVNRSNHHRHSRTRSDNNNNDDKYRPTRDSGGRQHQHQSSSSSSPRRREERRIDERRPRHQEEKASSSHHNERRDRSSSRKEPSSSSVRRDYPVDRPYTPSSSNRKEKESSSNRLHTSSSSPSRRHGNDTTPSTSSHRHHRQQSSGDHHNTTNKRREKFAEI